jgi:hypothetical protein
MIPIANFGQPMSTWPHRDYGVVAKCPHCDRVDIPRVTPRQITCGAQACRDKQNQARHVARAKKGPGA